MKKNIKNIIRILILAMYVIAWPVFGYVAMMKFTLILTGIIYVLIIAGHIIYFRGDEIPKIRNCYMKLMKVIFD